jgi:hypothetical protein
MVLGAVSAAAIATTYAWSPEEYSAGGVAFYNVLIYLPLFTLSFVCWGVALAFYISFIRQRVPKPFFKVIAPAILLLPFIYDSIFVVRWLARNFV